MIGRQEYGVTEQETQPLDMAAIRSAMAFCQYLRQYELSQLDVSLVARVRYLTVWNIAHGIPVKSAHAVRVHWALQKLTGVAYTASIVVTSTETTQ